MTQYTSTQLEDSESMMIRSVWLRWPHGIQILIEIPAKCAVSARGEGVWQGSYRMCVYKNNGNSPKQSFGFVVSTEVMI